MGDRQERASGAKTSEPGRGTAVERKVGRTVSPHHLDACPEHPPRVAGPKSLHRGFLRGEASRERRHRVALAPAIGNLAFSEHSLKESVAEAIDRGGDPG